MEAKTVARTAAGLTTRTRLLLVTGATPLATNWAETPLLAAPRFAALGFAAPRFAAAFPWAASLWLAAGFRAAWLRAAGFRAAGLRAAGLAAAFGWAASDAGCIRRVVAVGKAI